MKRHFLVLGGLAVGLVVVGCGGQGTSNSFGSNSTGFGSDSYGNSGRGGAGTKAETLAGAVPVFLTSSTQSPFEHFWVRAYEVQVQTGKETVPVVNDPDGRLIDLATLHDGRGSRLMFFGAAPVDEQVVRLQVLLDRKFWLYGKGETQGRELTFSDNAKSDDGRARLTLNVRREGSGLPKALAVDFDLSKFTEDKARKGQLNARAEQPSSLDDETRHEQTRVRGTVASVDGTAPKLTLVVDLGRNRMARAVTSTETSVLAASGDEAPLISQGTQLEIVGKYSPTAKALVAEKIEVFGSNDAVGPASVAGLAKFEGEKLIVSVRSASGFAPKMASVKLELAPDAALFGADGKKLDAAGLKAALASPAQVEARGVYEEGNATLKVARLRVIGGKPTDAKPAAAAKPAKP
jgi:hypothetical protein